MTLLDQMEKRPGTVMAAMFVVYITVVAGLFVGALLIIKKIFFS